MKQTLALLVLLVFCATTSAQLTYDGSVELEQRYFFDTEPGGLSDSRGQTSVRLEMEFFTDWNDGSDQLIFEPLLRIDSLDDERTHADIRQLIWSHFGENYEFSAGIGRVFWGVTESQQLVDIINQTDGVENIDGEDKLGQPMLRYSYFNELGNLDAFLLPYFRTRTFEGPDGRLNGNLVVDNDRELFESTAAENNLDFALRYSNTFGDWGVGLAWFSGTSREPDLFRFIDFENGTTTPYYPQIDQFSTDIQLTTDAWLIKLEAIQRDFDDPLLENFAASTLGFEYTFVGILGTVYDLGLLSEYSWDERGEQATSIAQNDIFVGARLALNDISDSQLLLGFSNDLDNSDSKVIFVEAATRVASALTLNVEMRYFSSDTVSDPLFQLADDSFIQIGLEYFFD